MNKPTTPPDGRQTTIENFYLLQRIALGILVLGVDELTQRLQEWQKIIDADPERVWSVKDFSSETSLDKLTYFMLGSFLRIEKRGVKLAAGGLQVAQDVAQTTVNVLQPLFNSRLMRPFQRPLNRMADKVEGEIQLSVYEGRSESHRGRALTETSLEEVMGELIDYLARDPEVMSLVRQQSTGLANTVVDNGRELTVSADTVVEAALRRLLRMTPRAELPQSPLAGKPQDMYQPLLEDISNDSP